MKTVKMGNYELEVNDNNEVIKIMQQKPYKQVYAYRHTGFSSWAKHEVVKYSTLRNGLNNGNWRLY